MPTTVELPRVLRRVDMVIVWVSEQEARVSFQRVKETAVGEGRVLEMRSSHSSNSQWWRDVGGTGFVGGPGAGGSWFSARSPDAEGPALVSGGRRRAKRPRGEKINNTEREGEHGGVTARRG